MKSSSKFAGTRESGSGVRGFSGSAADARLALAVLSPVGLFGVSAVCYGLWQIATGRRSKWVVYLMVAIGAALFWVALLI